ncbi:MAG: META domain-containing protein [Spirochaeta sp.]|jgi:hypothetical protein|nr:META domain-containing protein [Spirochaeta sp.]
MKRRMLNANLLTLAVILVAIGGGALWADGMPVSEPDAPAVSETAPEPESPAAPDIDPSIIGAWLWTEAETPVGSLSPLPRQEYTITFREDGTMMMDFESNDVNGTFTADGTTVAISPESSNRVSWLPGSPAPRLIELLSEARDYALSGGTLELETLAGRGSINFDRVN